MTCHPVDKLPSNLRVRKARIVRRRQHGAATLIVVMVLFFIISLVAAYTSRNLIFEQRTANNQYRSTQALEVAEAGLEWAISMLNYGRIDDACVASTNPANSTFRQRYLNVDDAGRITADLTPAGGDLLPSCVSNGTGGWTCSCPTTGAPTLLPSSTATQVLPAFRVRFQRVIPSDPVNPALAKQPGVVRVQVVGCTRLDAATGDQCLNFNGQGAFNEARVIISSMLALTGGASSPPQAALTARRAVDITGAGYSAYNTGAAGSGITVQSGRTVSTAAALVSSPGSPGGIASIVADDPALNLAPVPITGFPDFSPSDRMFAAVFNLRPQAFRDQQAALEFTCPCSAAAVQAAALLNPGRPIWVAGDLTGVATDIGSPTEPVLLVINGNLQFTVTGANIYGLVYARTNDWDTRGPGQIIGASVAEGRISGNATTTFAFDPTVMQRLRWNTGSFVRVPGSWKDFQ